MNIVLLEPEIPANTGNIGRSCVATNTKLHLIEPFGFRINEKQIKRAGMDYWENLDVSIYSDLDEFYEKNPDAIKNMHFATTKAHHTYKEAKYAPDDYIMFGRKVPEFRRRYSQLMKINASEYLCGVISEV